MASESAATVDGIGSSRGPSGSPAGSSALPENAISTVAHATATWIEFVEYRIAAFRVGAVVTWTTHSYYIVAAPPRINPVDAFLCGAFELGE